MTNENTFDDFETGDGPFDSVEVNAYGEQLAAAVETFGVLVLEPGETR